MSYSYNFEVNATEGLLAFAGSFVCATLVFVVFQMICMFLIYRKAGYGGWEAFIPVYNTYCLFKLVGMSGWLIVLGFIPIANLAFLVFAIMANYKLPLCFGKSAGWGVLNIFFSVIILPILAFSKNAEYTGHC